jgi:hypothetical protein
MGLHWVEYFALIAMRLNGGDLNDLRIRYWPELEGNFVLWLQFELLMR